MGIQHTLFSVNFEKGSSTAAKQFSLQKPFSSINPRTYRVRQYNPWAIYHHVLSSLSRLAEIGVSRPSKVGVQKWGIRYNQPICDVNRCLVDEVFSRLLRSDQRESVSKTFGFHDRVRPRRTVSVCRYTMYPNGVLQRDNESHPCHTASDTWRIRRFSGEYDTL